MSGREVRMVDITEKPAVYREATARGYIRLKPETLQAIIEGRVPKGDVLNVARTAAILAVKRTWETLPLCHPIPITSVSVDFNLDERGVEAVVTVKTTAQTGVEMEALTGVSIALLTIWDMVKALEKDERGQYPHTIIQEIRVLEKVKGEQNRV
ncbi:MAG: cyclic pyranopterin monophosphate synthase MoaC [Infirmifilum sp.]|jgi:cyclic pyranopterin phosphate synthase|uniref:Probable cyclic pyranopterin monophosphate synthase n=1 Tax=Infirmifilum uzonense TaxID=1550241 RepID=A0A0F7FJX9_9CREN|nr:cyclic pyranopterin monophosphate synthase MoaC [Infirmifilum uzonense]AKG39244.1 molybdenum cofactor biosynthesis protein MoaC [Infirmifilum uzonense]